MNTLVTRQFTVNKNYCKACDGVGRLPRLGPSRPGEILSISAMTCPECNGSGLRQAKVKRRA
jgi:hypothetical protein